MIKKFVASLLCTSLLCLSVCTAAYTEDTPMTEEEILYYEEDYAVEAQTEEEALIVAEEDGFLEEDGLIAAEEDEVLEAAEEDFDFDTAFPDDTFRDYLEQNGWTNLTIIESIVSLPLNNKGIQDLTGIHYFSNLKSLDCGNNSLTSLDVSSCTALEELKCHNNHLESLNVSGCTQLKSLNCYGNQLKKLDVSKNIVLVSLICNTNGITSLDMSNHTSLKALDCRVNNLTTLLITGCIQLGGLYCSHNELTSLDVSECTSLKLLHCGNNQLTSLDVSFCDAIKDLYENTEPTEINGFLDYSADRGSLNIDPSLKVLTVHEHAWDGGKVTKKPTTTAEGVKTYTCTIAACGQTNTEKIPKLKETTPAEQITVSKKPTIKKPVAAKGKITVNWKHFKNTTKKGKKIWKKIKKVQVQCATDSAFTNIVKSTMVGKKKTKTTIKGLAKKTTYYVRVRYYDGTGYSAWSKMKKVKTK